MVSVYEEERPGDQETRVRLCEDRDRDGRDSWGHQMLGRQGGSSPRAFRESVSLKRLAVRLGPSRMREYASVLRRAAPGHWHRSVHAHRQPAELCRLRHRPSPVASLTDWPQPCPAFGDSHRATTASCQRGCRRGVGLHDRESSDCALLHCQLNMHRLNSEPWTPAQAAPSRCPEAGMTL